MADRPVSRRRPVLAAAAIVALTAAALAGGARRWPAPERTAGGWRVAAVPTSLAVFLAAATVCCVAVAAALTVDVLPARPRAARIGWWVAVLAAAAGAAWHVLVVAAQARAGLPVVPVLDWALPVAPALLAGAACVTAGPRAALVAALGTGVVSLPLAALGWALYGARSSGSFLGAPLTLTVWLGALPLLFAAVLAAVMARAYASGVATEQSRPRDVYLDGQPR